MTFRDMTAGEQRALEGALEFPDGRPPQIGRGMDRRIYIVACDEDGNVGLSVLNCEFTKEHALRLPSRELALFVGAQLAAGAVSEGTLLRLGFRPRN